MLFNEKKKSFNLNNILTKFDIFGESYKLTFDRKRLYTASLGGTFTILFFSFIICSILILGSQLYLKDQPRIVNFTTVTPNMTVDYKMPFAVSIYDITNTQLDLAKSDLFEVYFYMNSSDITRGYELPKKLCQMSDLNITQQEFEENRLENALCVDNLAGELTELNGYWINSFMTFLGIYVGPCVQGLRPGVKCKSLKEIKEYMFDTPLAVSIQFQEYAYNPVNYTHPLSYYIKTNCYMIDPMLYLQVERYATGFQIQTDSGLIFPGWSYINTQKLDPELYIQSDYFNWDSVKQIFIQYIICASPKTDISQRSYLNLSALISQIGGLVNVIFQLIHFITGVLYNNLMAEGVVNILFDIDDKKKFNPKLIDLKKVVSELDNNSGRNINIALANESSKRIDNESVKDKLSEPRMIHIYNKEKFLSPDKYKPINMMSENSITSRNEVKKDKKILANLRASIMKFENFSIDATMFEKKNNNKKIETHDYWDYIAYMLCRCMMARKTKNFIRMYKEIDKLTMDFTDIVSIVKNQYDTEKLKYLLFDEIQIAIFNSSGKLANPLKVDRNLNDFSKIFINSKNPKAQQTLLNKYLCGLDENIVRNSSKLDQKLLQIWE